MCDFEFKLYNYKTNKKYLILLKRDKQKLKLALINYIIYVFNFLDLDSDFNYALSLHVAYNVSTYNDFYFYRYMDWKVSCTSQLYLQMDFEMR